MWAVVVFESCARGLRAGFEPVPEAVQRVDVLEAAAAAVAAVAVVDSRLPAAVDTGHGRKSMTMAQVNSMLLLYHGHSPYE